jgi:hypothetical protein
VFRIFSDCIKIQLGRGDTEQLLKHIDRHFISIIYGSKERCHLCIVCNMSGGTDQISPLGDVFGIIQGHHVMLQWSRDPELT